MKVGFLDCIFNYADVFETASAVMQGKISNVNIERLTAPHLLKIPVCSRMLFGKGCDAVVVFLTVTEDDLDELNLVMEKTIDVEVMEKKFVVFCVVKANEFRNEKQLNEVTMQRLDTIMEAVVKMLNAPSELSSDIQNTDLAAAMNAFSSFAVQQQETQQPRETGSRSLF